LQKETTASAEKKREQYPVVHRMELWGNATGLEKGAHMDMSGSQVDGKGGGVAESRL